MRAIGLVATHPIPIVDTLMVPKETEDSDTDLRATEDSGMNPVCKRF